MTGRAPTPQGISRLLREAGFPRSDYGGKGVMRESASTGFIVWKTYHRDHPEQPYVAVQYIVKGMHATDEDWDGYMRLAPVMLGHYAEVIRAAGYAALVRDRGGEPPWLTILTVVKDSGRTP
jgi:hypothetical protein